MTKKEERLRAKKFQLIGEFIFQFSQLEFSIKIRLSDLLKMDESLFDIVIGPYDFALLCTVTQKVLVDRYPTSEKAIKDLFKRCHALNNERLRVVHGTWAEGTEGLASRHASRQKLSAEWYYDDPLALQKHIEEAKQVVMAVLSVPDKASSEQGSVMLSIEVLPGDAPKKHGA
jgi:hypothetical protein